MDQRQRLRLCAPPVRVVHVEGPSQAAATGLRVGTPRPDLEGLFVTNKPAPRHMRPGGWFESQDFCGRILSDDNSLGDSTLPEMWRMFAESLGRYGMKYWYVANDDFGPLLEAAGFINVSAKTIKVPIGTWPKVRGGQIQKLRMWTSETTAKHFPICSRIKHCGCAVCI